AVDGAVAGDTAGATGGRHYGIDDAALGRANRNGAGVAVTVGYLLRHDRAQRGIHGRFDEREGRVDAAPHLRRGAGEVGGDVVAFDGQSQPEDHGLRLFAEPVDVVGEVVGAVGNGAESSAGEPLCVVVKMVVVFHDGRKPKAPD